MTHPKAPGGAGVVIVIPARYAASRLPGKPLLARTGKTLIQHVVEVVRAARSVEQVIVATDDERIRDACSAFGARAIMTPPECPRSTASSLPFRSKIRAEFSEEESVRIRSPEDEKTAKSPAPCRTTRRCRRRSSRRSTRRFTA